VSVIGFLAVDAVHKNKEWNRTGLLLLLLLLLFLVTGFLSSLVLLLLSQW
jgi:hypothetical protein